jgi:bisphosphoglycerate-independent phosphoglycerate mutase (AlkP superfamily)
MDADVVPGVIFSNQKLPATSARLMDVGPTVLDLFGVDVPAYMSGRSLVAR